MIALKKILVCEFITGGGLCGEALPPTLVKEGALMRDALLRDLADLPYAISTTVDARLSPPKGCDYVIVPAHHDIWAIWMQQLTLVDAAILIAPETEGALHHLTQIAMLQGKLVLGCGLDAIETTANKLATFLALTQANIQTITTLTFDQWQQSAQYHAPMRWLAKPIDGVGCASTVTFDKAADLMRWMIQNKKQHTHIVQPYHEGQPASISCIMKNGKAYILSCNTQIIDVKNQILSFKGVIVNGMRAHWQAFELLANRIAAIFPDLAGYVGVDVIVQNEQMVVVEINPRLSTSYVGLHEATGVNPAKLIINTLTQPDYQWPSLQQNSVTIHA